MVVQTIGTLVRLSALGELCGVRKRTLISIQPLVIQNWLASNQENPTVTDMKVFSNVFQLMEEAKIERMMKD